MLSLEKIKNIYNFLPTSLTAPLFLIPHSLIGGKQFRETLRELDDYDRITSASQRHNLENSILCEFLSDAIKHVPFYRDWASKRGLQSIKHYTQIFDFPLVGKELVQDRIEEFIDDRCKAKFPVYTGGTSGSQLKFYHSNKAYAKEWAFLSNFLAKTGISIDEKRYSLRGVDIKSKRSHWQLNPVYKEFIISPHAITPDNVEKMFSRITAFDGKWIHGYPSTVYQFCLALKEKNLLLPSVKAVFLVSEKLHNFQKDLIEQVLDANIVSFYGMSERVVFAPSTQEGFTPHRCYGVSELVDGEHIATGFTNDGTCLIRYRTGDCLNGELDSDGFVKRFESFEGRWGGDFIVGLSGSKINMTVLNTHSELLNDIDKYQFNQSKLGYCDLLLQTTKPISEQKVTKIQELFQAKLGADITLSCRVVEGITVTSRGKHKFIHSNLS